MVLNTRPFLLDGNAQAEHDQDGSIVLKGHAVGASRSAGERDRVRAARQVACWNVDGNQHPARAALGTLDEVAIVAADHPGQTHCRSIELDCACFSIVAGEDAGCGLLLWGQPF